MIRRREKIQRGIVSVEFALVAPLMFLFIFGMVEFARVCLIRHAVDNAAYEAARVGIVPGATTDEVNAVATAHLGIHGLTAAQIQVTPFPLDEDSEDVTVTVTVDVVDNSWVTPLYTHSISLTGRSTLGTERFRGFTPAAPLAPPSADD